MTRVNKCFQIASQMDVLAQTMRVVQLKAHMHLPTLSCCATRVVVQQKGVAGNACQELHEARSGCRPYLQSAFDRASAPTNNLAVSAE